MSYRGIVVLNSDKSWTFRALIEGGFWKNYRITKELATKIYELALNSEMDIYLKELEEEYATKSKKKTRNVRRGSKKARRAPSRRAA